MLGFCVSARQTACYFLSVFLWFISLGASFFNYVPVNLKFIFFYMYSTILTQINAKMLIIIRLLGLSNARTPRWPLTCRGVDLLLPLSA